VAGQIKATEIVYTLAGDFVAYSYLGQQYLAFLWGDNYFTLDRIYVGDCRPLHPQPDSLSHFVDNDDTLVHTPRP
jgi:hypothetical protein